MLPGRPRHGPAPAPGSLAGDGLPGRTVGAQSGGIRVTSDDTDRGPPTPATDPASGWWLLGPVVALMVVAIALVGVTIGLAAIELDRAMVAGSQRLADSSLRTLRREIALWAKDYAFWGATVENVVVSRDPDWTATNLGQYIFDSFGMTATIAIDAEDRVIHFAADATRPVPDPGFARAAVTALAPLIAEARAAPLREPTGVSGFAEVAGAVLVAGAAAITPERPTAADLEPHSRPVLLFVRVLDGITFAALQDRFDLPELRLVRDAAAASAHACPIHDADGEVLGWLDWTPPMPGVAMLARLVWPLLAIGVTLVGVGALVLRRVLKANRDLHDQARALLRANEQLSQNADRVRSALQRAEHATRAKSSFLAGVSHELRTPLTAIIGFSQILKLQHRPGKPKSREQEYAEIIHDSSQHLLNLVNDILDLSKIESGGYELDESWIDVAREAKIVRSLLAHEADRRGVTLAVEMAHQLPALYGDAKSLRQIIINLMSNALKFTERGGWARLSVRPDDDGGLLIEVVDNGTGIAPEDQQDIWEAFKRARNPAMAKAEGTGLGLHLVKILAGLHGADVGLESALGQGTRIWVAFGPERVRVIA